MMIEDLGGMLTMTGFPDGGLTMTGVLGETWMMTGCQDELMMTGFPGGARTPDLVLGDRLLSQVDGERKKKPERRVGALLENRDLPKNVNGREKETGTTQTARRTTRTPKERETGRGTGTERSASEDPGTKVAGGEDQLKKPQAGEIRVAEMIGIGTGTIGAVIETTGGT